MAEQMLNRTGAALPDRIAPRKLAYSSLYLDQIAGKAPAAEFFVTRDIRAAASKLDSVTFDRKSLAEILHSQNLVYSASEETHSNIDKLADERTLCVFSGQQAGFLGGPLLTLVKALAVVKAAGRYSEELGRPVVPIFWIAGDDHDFEEANHTWLLNREGAPCRNAYNTAPELAVPASEIKFCDRDELTRAKKQLIECLGETDFTDRLMQLVDHAYTPSDTFVTAFGRFMAGLTAEYGLIFFSPGDSGAKRLAAPLFEAIIEKQAGVHDLLTARNSEIERAGYHIQVEKSDDSTHLFYNLDGRRPVVRDGDGFTVGDSRFTKEELLDRIREHPDRFSPDVMTRPLMQSYLFPVVSQKGGPAEIAYLAQLNPLFDLFDLVAPHVKARATMTLTEARFEKMLLELDVEFEELTGDIEQVVNRILARTFPADLEGEFNELRQALEQRFSQFRREALEFDPQLARVAEQAQGKIDYTLKGFEQKVWAAHKRKSQQTRDKVYRLYHALYTNRGLQERALNVTYFISRYGFDIIPYMYDRLDSEETDHQLISLSEYTT